MRNVTLSEQTIREMNKEETIETLQLALRAAREQLTVIELAQEVMKVLSPQEVKETLSKLRIGKYL
jgi:hypothetical protein